MVIIPVTGITKDDKEEVKTILFKSLYITGIETTTKSHENGRYLLLTTNTKKANAQREVDNLLGKYLKKKTNQNDSTNRLSIYINALLYVRISSFYFPSIHEHNYRS